MLLDIEKRWLVKTLKIHIRYSLIAALEKDCR